MRGRIDSHAHISGDSPELIQLLKDLDLSCFNICVVFKGGPVDGWRAEQRDHYRDLARRFPDSYRWTTSFDLPDFDDPDYVDRVIAGLDEDFAAGAIAVKTWKNIGMGVKTPEGDFMQVDHPLLTPIYDHLAREGRVALMHIGEPLACWRALDPDSPHYGYYKNSPQWHMHGRDDHPSHEAIMAAWDRMLDRHRDLTVIGAHFGSQEYDVRAVAERMDRFPNFAVDTSARLADLAWQDPQRVRDFLDHYGDRVLFGVDYAFREWAFDADDVEAARARFITDYRQKVTMAYDYFERSGAVTVDGREVQGLALPEELLDRIYRENALRWYKLQAAAV